MLVLRYVVSSVKRGSSMQAEAHYKKITERRHWGLLNVQVVSQTSNVSPKIRPKVTFGTSTQGIKLANVPIGKVERSQLHQ